MRSRVTGSLAISIAGPIERADLPGLYARVCRLLSTNAGKVIVCDVNGVRSDAVAVEALARLRLGAKRHGCRVRLRGASGELLELLAFMGLANVS
jgi:ABC-type transporter Mla MlaB component